MAVSTLGASVLVPFINHVAVLVWSSIAAIGPAPGSSQSEEPGPQAQALGEQAQGAARAGELERAVTLFEQARALDGRAVWDCNIAVVYYQADEDMLAMHFFERCLARADELEDGVRDGVEQGRAFVRERLEAAGHAEIQFELSPSEAVLTLDELPVGRIDPHVSIWLAPGEHALRVEAPDHVGIERVLVVEPGRHRDMVIELSREPEPEPEPEPAPPVPELPAVEDEPASAVGRSPRTAWVVAGVGYGLAGLGLVTGAALHAVARSTRRDLEQAPEGAARDALLRTYNPQRAVAFAGYGLALVGAGLGVGMTIRALRGRAKEREVARRWWVTPWVGLGDAGMGVGWRI